MTETEKKMWKCDIKRAEVTSSGVEIELNSGVVLSINSNPGYFHFSLSRVQIPLKLANDIYYSGPVLETNNVFQLAYKPTSDC